MSQDIFRILKSINNCKVFENIVPHICCRSRSRFNINEVITITVKSKINTSMYLKLNAAPSRGNYFLLLLSLNWVSLSNTA